jgi:hypothetical protein
MRLASASFDQSIMDSCAPNFCFRLTHFKVTVSGCASLRCKYVRGRIPPPWTDADVPTGFSLRRDGGYL